MAFLSRLRLHPRDLAVLRDLGDVAEMHRTVMRGFPDLEEPTPRAQLRVLYRVERAAVGDGESATVLVQSRIAPDWTRLPEGYCLQTESRNLTDWIATFTPGQRFRFRLVGNPSRKTSATRDGEPRPRNSRRVAVTSDEARLAWLAARGAAGGFALLGGDAGAVRIDEGAVSTSRHGIHVRPARFEGALEITDVERFREALSTGIGPAKAYGCGLLSLASL